MNCRATFCGWQIPAMCKPLSTQPFLTPFAALKSTGLEQTAPAPKAFINKTKPQLRQPTMAFKSANAKAEIRAEAGTVITHAATIVMK